ncbi:TPA: hypothetical protein ACJR0B_000340 [Streptococcus agalactiae]
MCTCIAVVDITLSQSTKPKIIGYNELLRLVHYNRQGEGYNETEKPEKYAKFHYI